MCRLDLVEDHAHRGGGGPEVCDGGLGHGAREGRLLFVAAAGKDVGMDQRHGSGLDVETAAPERFHLERYEGGSGQRAGRGGAAGEHDVRSEEHTSELQSLMRSSYAVFCLKKKKTTRRTLAINN